MASEPLSKERVKELEDTADMVKPEVQVCDVLTLTYGELCSLLSAYRTREAAIAECEAWRAGTVWIDGGNFRWCDMGAQAIVDETFPLIAATDAARREEGQ